MFADEYAAVVEIAVSNLYANEMTESSAYARAVADAYLEVVPVVGLQMALYEHQAVAWAVSVEKLAEKLHYNRGAMAAIAVTLVRHADVADRARMLQIARLLRHCDHSGMDVVDDGTDSSASLVGQELAWKRVGSILDARYNVTDSALRVALRATLLHDAAPCELGVVTWVGVLEDGRVLRYCSSGREGHAVGADDDENLQWFANVKAALADPGMATHVELGELLVRAERRS
jgi:hypothetical protein